MRRIHFADISIFLVNRIFNWRFWIAGLTKKSKIAKKVINKLLFEKDDVVIIPNTIHECEDIWNFITDKLDKLQIHQEKYM